MSSKSTAVTIAAIVVSAASLGFAGYETYRAGELAGIAAEAHMNGDAAQRQYLASLEYRIARLEEGVQGDYDRDDAPTEGQEDSNAPEYQKGMLQAAHRHPHRISRHACGHEAAHLVSDSSSWRDHLQAPFRPRS